MSDLIGPKIGANLRALRTGLGLSVVALAERSGVARATLTKLEAGQGNPTIDTLYALADALGASLGALLDEHAPAPVEVLRRGEGMQVKGAVTARLLDRVHGQRLAELYEVRFATKVRHADPHPRGVMEHLVLTSGRMLVGPEDAPVELATGDFVRFPGDVPHLYQALEAEATGVLVMSHS